MINKQLEQYVVITVVEFIVKIACSSANELNTYTYEWNFTYRRLFARSKMKSFPFEEVQWYQVVPETTVKNPSQYWK